MTNKKILFLGVVSVVLANNFALAAGGHAAAVSAVHTETAKTTTGADMNAANTATAATADAVAAGNNTTSTFVAYDPTTPYYAGATLGWGDIYQTVFSGPAHNSSSAGFAGRIYLGYRFTDNYSVEGGFLKFSDVTGNYTTTTPLFGTLHAKGVIRTYVFDAEFKITEPLKNKLNRFNVYGKVGMAYLNETGGTLNTDALLIPQIPGTPVEPINLGDPVGNKLLPTFSVGINYHIIKHVEADLVWMHIQMIGSSGALNNTDLVALGLAYSF